MTFLFLLLKPILLMLVRKVFKKQMKEFAVQMMEEYAKTTDNDIDDALVAKIRKSMRFETQESLDKLFTAKWNLPKAAKNCGMSYDEMRILFNNYCLTHPTTWKS